MIIKANGKEYACFLGDNGTLDTVITVDGQETIFDHEYASEFRVKRGRNMGKMTVKGFKELALEAIESIEEEHALEK